MTSRHNFHNQVFFYCVSTFVFMMPVYGKILPPIIALMVLNWLIDGHFIKTFPRLFREPLRWRTLSFSAIYLLYLAGMIYTSNYHFGWFDLEIKLSLLLFPLLFSTMDNNIFDKGKANLLLKMFVAGCFIGSVVLLIHALINKTVYHTYDSFVYLNLSWDFHPSYYSMYLVFAMVIIADFFFFQHSRIASYQKILLVILVLFFYSMVFLLSSKAGIACMAIVSLFYISVLIFRKKMINLSLKLLAALIICFYGAYNLFPYAKVRIEKSGRMNEVNEQNSSTAERLTIWKISLPIIAKHPVLGVGTGDVKDELLENYRENGLHVILHYELNAHNQFIQTTIAIGLIGLLALVAMMILPAFYAFRHENYIYGIFILLFLVNNLVESMLETQAGVIFSHFSMLFFSGFPAWYAGRIHHRQCSYENFYPYPIFSA